MAINHPDDPRRSTPLTRPGNRPRWGRLAAFGAAGLAVAALIVVALSGWLISRGGAGRASGAGGAATADTGARPEQQRGTGNPVAAAGSNQTVGTAGDESEGRTDTGGPPAVVPPPVVQDLILDDDGQAAIGREVTLRVPIERHVNDVAFWTGEGENRILAVIGRDRRDSAMRQRGASGGSGIEPGAAATVTGTVQRLPHAEAMFSWGLTNADMAELWRRPIYLRIERIDAAAPPVPDDRSRETRITADLPQ